VRHQTVHATEYPHPLVRRLCGFFSADARLNGSIS
jgi:hypothetical protein